MAAQHAQVTVGTTEIVLRPTDRTVLARFVRLAPGATQTLYLGTTGVLTTTGLPMDVNSVLVQETTQGADELRAIASAAGTDVRILELLIG